MTHTIQSTSTGQTRCFQENNLNRFSYIDSQMLEDMAWITTEEVKTVNQLSVVKSSSDYKIITVLKLLYPLTKTELNFSTLHYSSGIRMKNSFLKYIRYCLEMGFIKKSTKLRQIQFYKITEKGHTLLDMFYVK